MLLIKLILVSCVLCSCSFSYTASMLDSNLSNVGLTNQYRYERMARWRLAPNLKVAVNFTESVDHNWPRTAKQIQALLSQEFIQHFSQFETVSTSTLNDMLQTSFEAGAEIFFHVRLTDVSNRLNSRQELQLGRAHFPDRPWGRDRLLMQFYVYETQTGDLLDLVTLSAKGAFLQSEDTIPLDLVQGSLKHFLNDLILPSHVSG